MHQPLTGCASLPLPWGSFLSITFPFDTWKIEHWYYLMSKVIPHSIEVHIMRRLWISKIVHKFLYCHHMRIIVVDFGSM